ncbi:hypothetical protein [Zavarzinia sp.]|uniref:hypothetical protein n=1 Tax=Zavarzinia sp. TaxID=2027920 RepID=UPI003567F406
MSYRNALVDFVLAALTAADIAGVKQIAEADHNLVRFLSGAGGKYNLPLLAVAYAGSPQTASIDAARLGHESRRGLVIFVVVNAVETAGDSARTINDLLDAIDDALTGLLPVDSLGAELGHPLENIGDSPVPLPAEATSRNLVAWSVGFQTLQQWLPSRAAVDTPDEFEKIQGVVGPVEGETQPEDDTTMDSLGVEYDDPTTD